MKFTLSNQIRKLESFKGCLSHNIVLGRLFAICDSIFPGKNMLFPFLISPNFLILLLFLFSPPLSFSTVCYPSSCCHSTSCSTTPPDCSMMMCTASCETVLDCGAGSCIFNDETGRCEVSTSKGDFSWVGDDWSNSVDDDWGPCVMLMCSLGYNLVGTDSRGCGGNCEEEMAPRPTPVPEPTTPVVSPEPCLALLCSPGHKIVGVDSRGCGGSCVPACDVTCSSWFDGCNACTCEEGGVLGVCTRMACQDVDPRSAYCLDGDAEGSGVGFCPEFCEVSEN